MGKEANKSKELEGFQLFLTHRKGSFCQITRPVSSILPLDFQEASHPSPWRQHRLAGPSLSTHSTQCTQNTKVWGKQESGFGSSSQRAPHVHSKPME